MARLLSFAVLLVVIGCSGSDFQAGTRLEQSDAQPPTGTGGAAGTGGRSDGSGGAAAALGTGGEGSRPASGGASAMGGAGSGGSQDDGGSSGAAGSGGAPSSGGSPSTGGVPGSGGAPSSGGVTGTGGVVVIPCNGAGLSTHHTGTGLTWTDCTPTGTYTSAEAAKACDVWCTANGNCPCAPVTANSTFCSDNSEGVYHFGSGSPGLFMVWLWQGPSVGSTVQQSFGSSSCTTVGTWN